MLKTVDPQAKACLAASGFGAAGAQGLNLTGRVPRSFEHRSQAAFLRKKLAKQREEHAATIIQAQLTPKGSQPFCFLPRHELVEAFTAARLRRPSTDLSV